MRKKPSILAGIIVLVFLSQTLSRADSFHIPGTLVLDQKYARYNSILVEGYYFLVFDNTGFLTNNFNRNDSYVIYFLEFFENGTEDVNGQRSVPKDDYVIITFDLELPDAYITYIRFEMYTSESISSFIVDYQGLAKYFELIGKITEEQQRTTLIIVSSISGGIILLLATNIVLMRNRVYQKLGRKIRAYRNKKAGKRFRDVG